MSLAERKLSSHLFITKCIETNHVPTPDCVCGVLAIAINALTHCGKTVTGTDIYQIVQEGGLVKGQFDQILKIVERKYGIEDVVMTVLDGITFAKEGLRQFYKLLFDRDAVVFGYVNGVVWYKAIGYTGNIPDRQHAVALNGYQSRRCLFTSKDRLTCLFVRDVNIAQQLLVNYDALYNSLVKVEDPWIIFFRNRDNHSLDAIQIPAKWVKKCGEIRDRPLHPDF